MADENILPRDQNHVTTAGFENSAVAGDVRPGQIIVATGRIKVDASGGGSGTVTEVSVVTANGFAGTVANSTTTPEITIETTVTGIVKGDGTAISAASPSTDYAAVAFKTIAVAGQTDIVADSPIDTLTFVEGSNITITTDATTDTITIAASGGSSGVDSVVGTANRISVDSTDPANPIVNIAGTYVGQTSITTLGTVTTGTLSTGAVIAGVTMTLGSDATGDIYYRSAGGVLTRLGIGSSTNVLTVAGGLPSWAAPAASSLVVGSTAISSGTTTRILYDNAGVLGEYTLTGSGTVVAMQTAPTFATSITTPSVLATANDSGAIGASGTAFSDLFLASGAVINFAANNSAITHSSGILTVTAGELRITSANVGTNADSVPTLSSTSTLTNKTLTSPAINTATLGGAQQLAEGASIRLDPVLSADGTYTGTTITGTAGAALAFGDAIYLAVADSRWELADASAVSTSGSVLLGFCVLAAAADGDPTVILLNGNIRADTAFPTLTVGAAAFISETAGDITNTAPTTTDSVTRVMGHALDGNTLLLNISPDWLTHV